MNANTVHTVLSLDHPGLEPYRTLRRGVDHIASGIFVAEGEKVVLRLLDSSLVVRSLLLTPRWWERIQATFSFHQEHPIDVFVAGSLLLREIVGYHLHQGIMAVGSVPPEPPLKSLPANHLLVALDGLNQSENVGVVVRNCAAFGVDAILVGERSSSPYLRRAVRNSMGTVFTIPVIHTGDLVGTFRLLREKFCTRIIAADAGAATPLAAGHLTGNTCLVVGNENTGITARTRESCDELLTIPMSRGIDSLNVASAAAVFLYEARKGRSL
jgi:tRNA G18 (ribose-2'-O)-methylase SpoU